MFCAKGSKEGRSTTLHADLIALDRKPWLRVAVIIDYRFVLAVDLLLTIAALAIRFH